MASTMLSSFFGLTAEEPAREPVRESHATQPERPRRKKPIEQPPQPVEAEDAEASPEQGSAPAENGRHVGPDDAGLPGPTEARGDQGAEAIGDSETSTSAAVSAQAEQEDGAGGPAGEEGKDVSSPTSGRSSATGKEVVTRQKASPAEGEGEVAGSSPSPPIKRKPGGATPKKTPIESASSPAAGGEGEAGEVAAVRAEMKKMKALYEKKLLAAGIMRDALQAENQKLRENLDAAQSAHDSSGIAQEEVNELQDEFARRLAAADKSTHQAWEEANRLREQLREVTSGNSAAAQLAEDKDQAIQQLSEEGDKLAKQVAKLEGILAKLRASEKEWETERERNNARIQTLEASLASCKRERDTALQDAEWHTEALRKAVAQHKHEIAEMEAQAEIRARAMAERARGEAAGEGNRALQEMSAREESLSESIEVLRQAFAKAEADAAMREDGLRREMKELESHNHRLQADLDEAAQRETLVMAPVLAQLNAATAHANMLQETAKITETTLRERLEEDEGALQACQEKIAHLEATIVKQKAAMAAAADEVSHLKDSLRAAEKQQQQQKADIQVLKIDIERLTAIEEDLGNELRKAEESLIDAKGEMMQSREREAEVVYSLQQRELEMDRLSQEVSKLTTSLQAAEAQAAAHASSYSPASTPKRGGGLWLGRSWSKDDKAETPRSVGSYSRLNSLSVAEASASHPTHGPGKGEGGDDDGLDAALRGLHEMNGSVEGGVNGGRMDSEANKEKLLARLRQQDGMLDSLRRQLEAAERARDHAAEAFFAAQRSAEEVKDKLESASKTEGEMTRLKKRHDMALVIIGERNERVEELEADLQEVRALYKQQIDLILQGIDPATWPQGIRVCGHCSHCTSKR